MNEKKNVEYEESDLLVMTTESGRAFKVFSVDEMDGDTVYAPISKVNRLLRGDIEGFTLSKVIDENFVNTGIWVNVSKSGKAITFDWEGATKYSVPRWKFEKVISNDWKGTKLSQPSC